MVSVDRLRAAFDYRPDSGELVWRCNRRGKSARVGAIAGYRKSTGYITVGVDGIQIYAHRIAWILTYGDIPEGLEIDHIDHDPSNNRISNLRLVTTQGNKTNMTRNSRNKSGITGVYWARHANAWSVQIMVCGVAHHLGYFKNLTAAAAARKQAEARFGFHPNHGAAA